ncbi:ubiquitin-conjugating enzyme E2 [Pavlovales sp. CCMP2436]|nr:ubiquitin-conjugating enzyme E2 [Pavlovales sp. CCMP2436]
MQNNRLMKEYREVSRAGSKHDSEISLSLENENSLLRWRGLLQGPPGTPYEGGRFELKIVCTSTYPLTPPKVHFVTKVFHPNVLFKTGEICLDILKEDAWTPAWTLQSVCRAVTALLSSPEADSPLNCDAGNLIRNGDQRGFSSMARMYTQLHAC